MNAKEILKHIIVPWAEDVSLDKTDYHAAVTAVNNTYGKGLDPEVYEDVVNALIISDQQIKYFLETGKIEESHKIALLKQISEALKKARI